MNPVPDPDFTDHIKLGLTSDGEPKREVLQRLERAFAEALAKHETTPLPPDDPLRNPQPVQSPEQQAAVARAFVAIEQEAAAAESEAAALKHRLETDGPGANAAKVAEAYAEIEKTAAWFHAAGIKLSARVWHAARTPAR